jgi:hypothetical protein
MYTTAHQHLGRGKLALFTLFFLQMLGTLSAVDSTCDPGSYLRYGQFCSICDAGFYCPGGTLPAQLPCSPGTYSEFEATSCTKCPQGYSCGTPTSLPLRCPLGSYSDEGASECVECTAETTPGAICAPSGTLDYCDAGEICDQTKQFKTKCPPTKYCPNQYSPDILDCPGGSFSSQGSTYCTPCPLGHYCPQSADAVPISLSYAPIECPDGLF